MNGKVWTFLSLIIIGSGFLFLSTHVSASAKSRPTVTSSSPAWVRSENSGLLTITVKGKNFGRGAVVALGRVRAKSVKVVSSSTIRARFERRKLSVGRYDVLIWNRDGGWTGARKLLTVYPAVDPRIYAVGDISDCTNENDTATAGILAGTSGSILALGDIAYPSGRTEDFSNCFQPAWGDLKSRILPAPGNHEYQTVGAAGYYSYFGDIASSATNGYYAKTLGQWRIYALNSNCAEVNGCNQGSAQHTWLEEDLTRHPRKCVLAFFHHPPFSSGQHGNTPEVLPLWQLLSDKGADVVLAGHDHLYERFQPLDRNGEVSTSGTGVRMFVVGTGGRSLYSFNQIRTGSEARDNSTYGVLSMTLHPDAYSWKFLPVAGSTYSDSGTTYCQ